MIRNSKLTLILISIFSISLNSNANCLKVYEDAISDYKVKNAKKMGDYVPHEDMGEMFLLSVVSSALGAGMAATGWGEDNPIMGLPGETDEADLLSQTSTGVSLIAGVTGFTKASSLLVSGPNELDHLSHNEELLKEASLADGNKIHDLTDFANSKMKPGNSISVADMSTMVLNLSSDRTFCSPADPNDLSELTYHPSELRCLVLLRLYQNNSNRFNPSDFSDPQGFNRHQACQNYIKQFQVKF